MVQALISKIDAESRKDAEAMFKGGVTNPSITGINQVAKCLSLYKDSHAEASIREAIGMTALTQKNEKAVAEVALKLSAPEVVSSIKSCASKFKEDKKVNWKDVNSAFETTAYKTTSELVYIALTKNEKAVIDAAKQISKAKTSEEAVRITQELTEQELKNRLR